MALNNFQSVIDTIQNGKIVSFCKESLATAGLQNYSLWAVTPDGGAIPSTSTALSNTAAGNLFQFQLLNDSLTNDYYISQWEMSHLGTSQHNFILCDRLVHSGGLSGIVTTEQTTNLPTAALTRNTNGVGVFIALEIYADVGTTGTTATVRYTNSAGVANRTSKPISFGGATNNTVGRFHIIPLQDGDVGVLSVEGVTLGISTGTAGNFGVTLFRPLFNMLNFGQFMAASQPRVNNSFIYGTGNCQALPKNGHYFLVGWGSGSFSGAIGSFYLTEG